MHVQSVQKFCFFDVKYANLWGFCYRRRSGCLSSLVCATRRTHCFCIPNMETTVPFGRATSVRQLPFAVLSDNVFWNKCMSFGLLTLWNWPGLEIIVFRNSSERLEPRMTSVRSSDHDSWNGCVVSMLSPLVTCYYCRARRQRFFLCRRGWLVSAMDNNSVTSFMCQKRW